MKRLTSNLAHFFKNIDGNFATTFAVLMVPLFIVIGSAVDYSTATRVKSDLQEAADSAAMAAAKLAADGGNEASQKELALQYFESNCNSSLCDLVTAKDIIVDGDKVRVDVVADSSLSVLQSVGFSAFPVHIASQVDLKKTADAYIDVYFVIDTTGSMNIADGEDEINKLRALFSPYNSADGCAFACHNASDGTNSVTENGLTGYEVAKNNGIYLREDRIRDELNSLAQTILTTPSINARVGLYKFKWGIDKLLGPKHQYGQVQNKIKDLIGESDGTSVEFALRELVDELPDSGSGKSQNDAKVITVLITDGMTQDPDTGSYEPLNTAQCDAIKNKGISLHVLNLDYPDLELLGHDDGNNPSIEAAKAVIDDIEPPLKSCASPNSYYNGDFGASVSSAFDKMLDGIKKETEDITLAFSK